MVDCISINRSMQLRWGYGYVAVSRSRTRGDGKLRRTDSLPVKEATADEVLHRTLMSANEDSDVADSIAMEEAAGENELSLGCDEHYGADEYAGVDPF